MIGAFERFERSRRLGGVEALDLPRLKSTHEVDHMGWFGRKKPVVGSPTLNTQKPQGTLKFNEVKRAYEGCLRFGGTPIMAFGQGQSFVREAWKPHYVGTGICQALVNYWIADHASGSSLWTRLYDRGVFNPETIVDIAKQQGQFGRTDNKGTDTKLLQKLRSEAFLERRGLGRRRDVRGGDTLLHTGGAKEDPFDVSRGWRIGNGIAYQGMANAPGGCYRMISFTSSTVSHVTCAWVQRDIAFFDPNYGEFWFENKKSFVQWFSLFWITDTYDNFDGYEIRDYSHRIRARN